MKNSYYVTINSVNCLYLIIDEVDVRFEEKNRNKYLILDSTNENKKILIKYTKLWMILKIPLKK